MGVGQARCSENFSNQQRTHLRLPSVPGPRRLRDLGLGDFAGNLTAGEGSSLHPSPPSSLARAEAGAVSAQLPGLGERSRF